MTARKQSTKKGGRKGKAEGSRKSIKERARAIIDSHDSYDEETRNTISNLLGEGSKSLAQFVRRAEAGEELYDLVRPLGSIEERARAILENVERYDYDTRYAVHVALSNVRFNEEGGGVEKYMPAAEARAELPRAKRDLREAVEKAEAGEVV
jgi:hypothetical protein